MPRYLSGRVRKDPPEKLDPNRYSYLGLNQAEPTLGDPGTSDPVPSGTQYQLVAVPGNPGDVTGNVRLNSIEAKVQALEVKVDKIIEHFGIK